MNAREKRANLEREMRQIVEHDGELSSEMATRFEQLETELDQVDAEIRDAEIRERFANRENQPQHRAVAPGKPAIETTDALGEQWNGYMRWWNSAGRDRSALVESRDLNTSDDSAVVPADLSAEMARLFGNVSGVRNHIRVSSYPTDLKVPTVATRVALTAVTAEGTEADETEPTFGEIDFTTDQNVFATTELTVQVMQDSRPELVSEVQMQHAEEIGRLWSSFYCNGLTVSTVQTDAIFSASTSGINTLETASASAITAAELIEARYEKLPAQYWAGYGNLSWCMGQDTFGKIMGLLDNDGRPIFQPLANSTLAADIQGTLLGLPVHIDSNAPAFSTGNAIISLMPQNAYRVVDREPGLVTNLNPWVKQSSGLVQVNTYQRSVGRWVRPEAGVIISLA